MVRDPCVVDAKWSGGMNAVFQGRGETNDPDRVALQMKLASGLAYVEGEARTRVIPASFGSVVGSLLTRGDGRANL